MLYPNNEYKYIYCHFDGYPEGVGATLVESYISREKINNLIALGKYEDANRTFLQSRELLRQNLISSIYDSLNEKIKIHQKLSFSGLKIV